MVVDKLIGLLLAVLILSGFVAAISKKANTAAVAKVFLDGFRGLQATALSPVTAK